MTVSEPFASEFPQADPLHSGPIPGTVSVVLSTYFAEKASNLEACLESIYAQTSPPNQVVIVVDGPVDRRQEGVIARYAGDTRVAETTVVRLTSNLGLAHALNAGLAACTSEYLMRMDSDDLSLRDRLELQSAYARAHPEIDVLSSWSEEFFEDGAPSQMKASPVTHQAIVRALRWRNVLVHPTLFIRADALRRVGGYRSKYGLLEDYDLFVRLALAGAVFHIIPKALVRVRSSNAQKNRRGGIAYCMKEIGFRYDVFCAGFLTWRQFIVTAVLYSTFRLVPGSLRRALYSHART
jgi:glycosyltransferase involved in cell wall biosynthesis